MFLQYYPYEAITSPILLDNNIYTDKFREVFLRAYHGLSPVQAQHASLGISTTMLNIHLKPPTDTSRK